MPATIVLVVLAIVFAVMSLLYWTGSLELLASGGGVHHKHAIAMAGVAVVCLIGANFTRPRVA